MSDPIYICPRCRRAHHRPTNICSCSCCHSLAPATGYASVASLPRVNGAKLNVENRAYQHPLCGLGNDRYMLMEGWRLVGWASAPYPGAGRHAIVYERLTPSEDDVFEVGKLYWCHGETMKMQICSKLPADLEDELGPWVRRHNSD